MSLSKKQKKQLDVARKKLEKLHPLVRAAKQQMDDPEELTALKQQVAEIEAQIEKIKDG